MSAEPDGLSFVTKASKVPGKLSVLRMKFAGSEAKPRVAGQKELPGKVN